MIDDMITTRGFEGEMVYREYKLISTPYKLPVYVGIVYFDLDKFKIRNDVKSALHRLGQYMSQYIPWTYW
jgi:hypothetical protein